MEVGVCRPSHGSRLPLLGAPRPDPRSRRVSGAICLHSPIDGSVTFTGADGQTVTVSFGPDCDGGFTTDVAPRWDWTHTYGDPEPAQAQRHLAGVVNAHVTHDVADDWIRRSAGPSSSYCGRIVVGSEVTLSTSDP